MENCDSLAEYYYLHSFIIYYINSIALDEPNEGQKKENKIPKLCWSVSAQINLSVTFFFKLVLKIPLQILHLIANKVQLFCSVKDHVM